MRGFLSLGLSLREKKMDNRRADNGSSSYELAEIRDHHEEIARLLSLGIRPKEIAERLGLHPQTVSNVRNSPIIKQMIEIIQTQRTENAAEIARQVAQLAPSAIKVMKETMEFGKYSEADDVELLVAKPVVSEQIKAALEVLRIAVPKTRIRVRSHIVDGEFINKIKQKSLTIQKRKEELKNEEIS